MILFKKSKKIRFF